ncbi:oxidoreductase [Streptomyces termitum]|uniref:nitric oxide dioxygenase n=2 Tax=Streptomyces termitum TaxID=67368 RepID=A0A918T5X2_9ACTN|nr:oxidoreductase [Streptomyces termitum]
MTTAVRGDAWEARPGAEGHRPGAGGEAYGEYHALLARQDAMRLRQRLLSPGRAAAPAATAPAPAAGTVPGPRDQETIRRYLPLVTPFGELIEHLYRAMFEQHPYLRGLFPDSMEFQRAHLERAFWFLIENLDRPDEIAAFCGRLGRDHRKLGVRPAHFAVFEAALAEGLRRGAGPGWVPELEEAWLRMIRFAVDAMVAGAEGAVGEPVSWNATVTGHELRRPGLAVLRVRTAEPFPYEAGQYASVESPALPHAWRPYSIACAPRPDGELEFHVRRTAPGGLSDVLVNRTRPGDALRLGPARGTAVLDGDPARDVLLVAGGTGWATAKALVEELAARRPAGRTAHLFLCARTLDDLYDTAAVAELERGRPWLRVVPVVDGRPGDPAAGSPAEAVARHGDWSGHVAYVSGPPAMVASVVERLAAAGTPAERLRHDPVGGPVPLAPRPVPVLV